MKGEYINLFGVSVNPETEEVVVLLKQETATPLLQTDYTGNRQVKNMELEAVDMYKAILSIGNARQLAEVLLECIERTEKNKGDL